jgi:hypothetical protein
MRISGSDASSSFALILIVEHLAQRRRTGRVIRWCTPYYPRNTSDKIIPDIRCQFVGQCRRRLLQSLLMAVIAAQWYTSSPDAMGLVERLTWIARRLRPQANSFLISQPCGGAFLESIQVDPSGVVRILGYSDGDFNTDEIPRVSLDGIAVPFLQQFRFQRTDVDRRKGIGMRYGGLVLDYLVPIQTIQKADVVQIDLSDERRVEFRSLFSFIDAHYRPLLDTREVFHRHQVYGSGPPNTAVSAEVLELAVQLGGEGRY